MEEKEIYWDIKDLYNYENFYDSGILACANFPRTYELVKNLSYNTQYLEYLSKTLSKNLHSTIQVETTKTYVLTGMSIIESILYYAIKSKNLHKVKEFEEITRIESNTKKLNDSQIKVETVILKKLLTPKEKEMNLNFMLEKTETSKLLGNDRDVYRKLNHLRKLRNKIHLYLIGENLDHDFNNFKPREYELMRTSLKIVLYSELFKTPKEKRDQIFDFI